MTCVIHLAGDVMVRRPGGDERSLHDRRARVALVRLVLERQYGTPPDVLADTVWPHHLPRTWPSALRTVVSAVRVFMATVACDEPVALEARSGRYVLRLPASTVVDLEQAERDLAAGHAALQIDNPASARALAAAAAQPLRSPLLAGHESDWISGRRDHQRQLLIDVLELESEAACRTEDVAGALFAAREAIRLAPLHESAHRCVMLAHAHAGNRAEALRAYESLRCRLAEELGAFPDPQTEAVYARLLR